MKDIVEIRWHGRGGQGAKTACLLLADAAFSSGKYVQGFPEYGPERMGAPITAYNRISDTRCTVHSNIYDPDYVVVVDESLIETVDVLKGLNPRVQLSSTPPRHRLKSARSWVTTRAASAPSTHAASRKKFWAKTSRTPRCWLPPSRFPALSIRNSLLPT